MWRRYKDSGDSHARERLVLAYSPLVKYVAGRMASGLPAHVEEADLISYGLLGLISAIERYDPDREIKFETFAITRIKGSIIDELRSLDWVPRSVRARARQIEKANALLEHKLHRAAARAREARRRPLLLREPHAPRDRRGAGRDRVARVAAPHQGRAAAQVRAPGRRARLVPDAPSRVALVSGAARGIGRAIAEQLA